MCIYNEYFKDKSTRTDQSVDANRSVIVQTTPLHCRDFINSSFFKGGKGSGEEKTETIQVSQDHFAKLCSYASKHTNTWHINTELMVGALGAQSTVHLQIYKNNVFLSHLRNWFWNKY